MRSDTLSHHLDAALQKHGSRTALEDASYRLTYADLDALSLTWAHRFRALRLNEGDRIVTLTGNSLWSAVALLATLRSGAVEVALHPSDAWSHILGILQEVKPALVIVPSEVMKGRLHDEGLAFPVHVAGTGVLAEHPDTQLERPPETPRADTTALIHYTSGSTGRPKGVMLSHGALAATLPDGEHLARIRNLRLLLGIPLAHAYGKTMLIEYLLAGACIVLERAFLAPAHICQSIQRHRASAIEAPPSVYEMLIKEDKFTAQTMPALEYLGMNSAKPREDLLLELRSRFPRAEIVVRYGISEIAGPLCRLAWQGPDKVPLSSCGKPVDPVRIRLCDENGNEVPAGTEGEVLVTSPGRMQGYFPTLSRDTEEYRTGDIARFDQDGYLYLLGRNNTMIKSAGHRVFPAEVESVVKAVSGVADCAVAGVPHDLLGEKICAWVVPEHGIDTSVLESRIVQTCKQTLGAVRTPHDILFRAALPKTVSGKIQVRELVESHRRSANRNSAAFLLQEELRKCGVKYVCGIVGREAQAILFDEHEDIQFILVHHEQTAGILCEVYARITGKPQACFSTLGPGVTNLATGVASALKDHSPLFALAAQVETNLSHSQTHQYLDTVSVMRPLTKRCFEPRNLDDLLRAIREAYALMLQKPKGPCFISIPIDLLLSQHGAGSLAGSNANVALSSAEPSIDRQRLQRLHRLLENANHPIVVCGGGALSRDIGKALASFIESRNIPLVTSLAAKGIVSDRHPLCLGAITKYSDLLVKPGLVKHVFSPVDLVLLVGYDLAEDFQPAQWRQGVDKVVCRLDEFANNAPEFVTLDLDVFGAPIEQSLAFLNSLPVARKKELAIDIGQVRKWIAEACQETGSRFNPAAIVQVVRRHMADSDILVSGVGLHKHYAGLFYEAYEPLTYISSNGLATMGFGLPGAMGAKLARPEAQVVAICGDGGFHLASPELDTCVRHQIWVKTVVFVDGAYGLIRHYQHKGTGRHADVSTCFSPGGPDFVKLAEANHCVGMRAESIKDFEEKFSLALKTDAPVVIAVPVEYPTF